MLTLALALLPALPELRSIALGERLTLTLPASESGDPELRLRLVAPRAGAVTVALESLDFDPVLRVETEDGRLLAEDDDSGLEQDARLTLDLDLEQQVVLVASAKRGGGELLVWVAAGEHPTPSGSALVDLRCARYAALAERALAREERYLAARMRFEEAHLHEERWRYPEARAAFEAVLLLARELGERELEAMTLSGLGLVERRLGRPARAREHFERCLSLARELGSLVGEASTSLNLGNLELDAGEGARARAHFERARELARALGDQRRERKALNSLGLALESLGEHERARDAHEAALALARTSGDRRGEAAARQNLGSLLLVLGEHEAAHEHELLALSAARELAEPKVEAAALQTLGRLELALGRPSEARERLEGSLRIALATGDREGELRARNELGTVALELGNPELALECLERALELAQLLELRHEIEMLHCNLGVAWLRLGEAQRALEEQEIALALARERGDRAGEARAHGNLANVWRRLGSSERALAHHERRLVLARELGDGAGEARTLGNLAALHSELGEHARAGALAREALAVGRGRALRVEPSLPLRVLARAALAAGSVREAREALEEAEGLIERFSDGGLSTAEAGDFRGRFADLGPLAQDLAALELALAGEDAGERRAALHAGFAAAGRWKGRALLEGIAEHRSGARSAEALALRRERRALLVAHDHALERVSRAIRDELPSAEVESLRAEAERSLAGAEQLAERLRERAPGEAALDSPLGAGPEELARVLDSPRELLVEYVEGAELLYAYVVGADVLEHIALGEWLSLHRELERFLGGIEEREALAAPAEVAAAGGALFERLVAPVLALAPHPPERLVIVPSATLGALPFEALVVEVASERPASLDELVFLLERVEVVYAPSSPVLLELAAAPPRAAEGRVLVLADPRYASEGAREDGEPPLLALAASRAPPASAALERLPGTREEAFAIARSLLGEERAELVALRARRSGSFAADRLELHLGEEATRARLAGFLRGYSVLHLACHGHVDAEEPAQSGVALSPAGEDAGWLTIQEALELDLDCELVVLSACRTARGAPKAGEGIESLARAFLYAGARGLVASLWPVDDHAAARTMEAFYDGWLGQGLAPAGALRRAKLALRHGTLELGALRGVAPEAERPSEPSESGHPFFWAPFVHVGLGASLEPRER